MLSKVLICPSNKMIDLEHIRDVVGQLPFLKSYIPIMLAFPLQDGMASQELAVKSLQSAALELVKTFSWLGAEVINKCSSDASSGLFEMEPSDLYSHRTRSYRFEITRISAHLTKSSSNLGDRPSCLMEVYWRLAELFRRATKKLKQIGPGTGVSSNFDQTGTALGLCSTAQLHRYERY